MRARGATSGDDGVLQGAARHSGAAHVSKEAAKVLLKFFDLLSLRDVARVEELLDGFDKLTSRKVSIPIPHAVEFL